MDQWHVSIGQKPLEGTYTRDEILHFISQYPDQTVYIWKPGMTNWAPATDILGAADQQPETPVKEPHWSYIALFTLPLSIILLILVLLAPSRPLIYTIIIILLSLFFFATCLFGLARITNQPGRLKGTPLIVTAMVFLFFTFVIATGRTMKLALTRVNQTSEKVTEKPAPEVDEKPAIQTGTESQSSPVSEPVTATLPEPWETLSDDGSLLYARNPVRGLYLKYVSFLKEHEQTKDLSSFTTRQRAQILHQLNSASIDKEESGALDGRPAELAFIRGFRGNLCIDVIQLTVDDGKAFHQVIGWTACSLSDENFQELYDTMVHILPSTN